MPPEESAPAILVCGMHRSGTSMVGGMLAALGVDMGRRLIPPDEANARGYFEDADIVEFHGRLFRALLPSDARGHVDWGWAEDTQLDRGRLREFAGEAHALADERARAGGPWGFKDPRTTLTLDLWEACLPDARFVLVYRFPWGVADSMQRIGADVFLRNPEYGYRIWTHYNEKLADFAERHAERCVLVSADALPRSLDAFEALLREKLGVEPPAGASLADAFDERLFSRSADEDPRADLTAAAYPECTALLERLDRLADISAVWRSDQPTRTAIPGPDSAEDVDVSIVVPTWNDGVLLLDALASIERCRPARTELVVVNDGSTDPETLRILAALRERGTFVLDKPNGGLSSARNAGIERARGRYILPLDADNRLRPGFIEAACEALALQPGIGVVYGDRQLFGASREVVRVPEFDLAKMLGGNYVDACAVYRRELWEDVGGYDTSMVGFEDWEYWIHASRRGWRFLHLPQIAFDYRVRPGSLLARSLIPAVRRRLFAHMLRKHQDLLHEHLPAVLRVLSAGPGRLVPKPWRSRLQRLECFLFWRPLWSLVGPGGIFAARKRAA